MSGESDTGDATAAFLEAAAAFVPRHPTTREVGLTTSSTLSDAENGRALADAAHMAVPGLRRLTENAQRDQPPRQRPRHKPPQPAAS